MDNTNSPNIVLPRGVFSFLIAAEKKYIFISPEEIKKVVVKFVKDNNIETDIEFNRFEVILQVILDRLDNVVRMNIWAEKVIDQKFVLAAAKIPALLEKLV